MAHLKTYGRTIVGFAYDADVYCVDCTTEYIRETFDSADEMIDAVNEGMDVMALSVMADCSTEKIPYPVFYDDESDIQDHCGNGRGCVNATTHHGYRHDLPIGQPIETTVIHYNDEEMDGEPKVERLDEDEVMITVQNSQFSYTYVYEIHDDVLTHLESFNKGTNDDEWCEPPASAEEAARFIVNEGKALGEF